MASAKGDSWLSCAGGWLGSAGGTTEPPRSQSPIGQGCGHAVGDDAAAQSLDDHWCLRCVQLTTLGETLCPSCKNNLIVPFKSSFHIPPYLALRHFASAWRHGGEDVVAETTADRETRTARAAQAAAGRLAFGLGSGDRSRGDSLGGGGGSSGGGVVAPSSARAASLASRVWQWRVGQRRAWRRWLAAGGGVWRQRVGRRSA